VLVVAPDQDKVWPEFVECLANGPDLLDDGLVMLLREGGAFVVAPLAPHHLGPVLRPAIVLRQTWILQQALQRDRPRGFGGESGVVGDAET
jgi:hypothetical protein